MAIWIILFVMCLIAAAFIIFPLYRSSGFFKPLMALIILLVFGSSFLFYISIGKPNYSSVANSSVDSDISEVIKSISEHLTRNPGDAEGWLMLGRSQQIMKKYDDAISSFERAMKLDNRQNSKVLVALAITLMEKNNGTIIERTSSLLEEALILEPTNIDALFYGGGAAASRGNFSLAADRWETLLELNSLVEIHEFLERKINEWRDSSTQSALKANKKENSIISLNIKLSKEALSVLPADTTVYIIARDPVKPSPPVAVTRRQVINFPLSIFLSDADSMMSNRKLSDFSKIEVVARASLSGEPAPRSGDWSGSLTIETKSEMTFDLIINEIIP